MNLNLVDFKNRGQNKLGQFIQKQQSPLITEVSMVMIIVKQSYVYPTQSPLQAIKSMVFLSVIHDFYSENHVADLTRL